MLDIILLPMYNIYSILHIKSDMKVNEISKSEPSIVADLLITQRYCQEMSTKAPDALKYKSQHDTFCRQYFHNNISNIDSNLTTKNYNLSFNQYCHYLKLFLQVHVQLHEALQATGKSKLTEREIKREAYKILISCSSDLTPLLNQILKQGHIDAFPTLDSAIDQHLDDEEIDIELDYFNFNYDRLNFQNTHPVNTINHETPRSLKRSHSMTMNLHESGSSAKTAHQHFSLFQSSEENISNKKQKIEEDHFSDTLVI